MDSPAPGSEEITAPAIIDLFAGVGGLSLGACRAGFDLKLAVENDPHAFAAHSSNFPSVTHSQEDIGELTGQSLLSKAGLKIGELCGLIGGPPCQGFSNMGHRQVDDSRNLLFQKFFTLVRETRPSFFLAENVPGILNSCYDKIRKDALQGLSEYVVLDPFEVCAADYGAPTKRKRVLFIGYLASRFREFDHKAFRPPEKVVQIKVGEALAGLPKKIKLSWNVDEKGWRKVRTDLPGDFGESLRARIPAGVGHKETLSIWAGDRRTSGCIATHHEPATVSRFRKLSPGEADKVSRSIRLDLDGLCPTLRAGTDQARGSYQAVRPVHPTEPRVITPREAARLQGFPDWFRFAPTKWHSFRQIGNSVSPILAEKILAVFLKHLIPVNNGNSS